MTENIAALTRSLVAVNSVNGSDGGERGISFFIEEYFKSLPYFKAHPGHLFAQDLPNDSLGRRNVFALVNGGNAADGRTVILHAHMDTVDVEDYGPLKPCAFSCDALREKLLGMKDALNDDMRKDLESGEWMFGRGSGDMKSGLAAFMTITAELSEKADSLGVNLLFMSNPVEENLHTGVMASLSVIRELKEKGYQFLFAVNSDCVTPLYPGDTTRYMYLGSIGKLLPCFYLLGEGDGAGRGAARLVKEVSLNPKYCDGDGSEKTMPPSVLKLRYEGSGAFVYFNYMVMQKNTDEVLTQMKEAAAIAMPEARVYEFGEVMALAKEKLGEQIESDLFGEASAHALSGTDKREAGLSLVKRAVEAAGIAPPAAVAFFAAPYCPHNTLDPEAENEAALKAALECVLKETEAKTGEHFRILKYFACLTDSSYLKLDDSEKAVTALKDNFPGMAQLYNVPLDTIRALNIPAINIGVFMKEPHQWTERVYMPFSFSVLPEIVKKLIEAYEEKRVNA